MSEELHVALPKLYGAPAYARPPRLVEDSPRPVDLDDLPLEAFRSSEDEQILAIGSNGNGNGHGNGHGGNGHGEMLEPRPFSLKSLSRYLTRS